MKISQADSIDWASLVVKVRKKLDCTQAELADKLKVDSQTVSNWENGNNAPTPKKKRILKSLARRHGLIESQGSSKVSQQDGKTDSKKTLETNEKG